jgi:ATP-binding cassette subfamily F protein 3
MEFGTDRSETELRTVLGCFLFEGDEVFKRIKVLSGGEKARVALAKTLLTEANFLLLDEPTNHLDMRSINILIQALQGYEGSFVVVSHDRFFVSQIANKIWWIEDQEIKEYPGSFEEYEYWRAKQEEELKKNPVAKVITKKAVVIEEPKKQAEKAPVSNNYIQKLKNQFEDYEKKVAATKLKLTEIENSFAKPENSGDVKKMEELNRFYDAEKKALLHLEKEMEAVLEELIELE